MAIIRGKKFCVNTHRFITGKHVTSKRSVIEYKGENYYFLKPSFEYNRKLYISSVVAKSDSGLDEETMAFCLAKGIVAKYTGEDCIDS